MKQEHWRVEVYYKHEQILSIEPGCLTGKAEFSEEEADTIRNCAGNLLAFIGDKRENVESNDEIPF